MPCSQPKGSYDVLHLDGTSDLGSLINYGVRDLCDGDPATADLQPGHLIGCKVDRRMMMNGHESEHAQNTRRTRGGSSPDVWFGGELRMGRRPPEAVPSAWDFPIRFV